MADYNLQFTGQQVQGILEEGDRLHAQVTLNETAIADIRKSLERYLLKSEYLISEQNINRDILENSEAISDNTAAIAQNQQGIAQNVTSIGKLTDALNALRVQLHELEWQKVELVDDGGTQIASIEPNVYKEMMVQIVYMNSFVYVNTQIVNLDSMKEFFDNNEVLTRYVYNSVDKDLTWMVNFTDNFIDVLPTNPERAHLLSVYVRGTSANASTATTTTKADADTNTVVVSNSDGTGQIYSIAEDGKTALSGSYVKVDDAIYVNGKVSTDDTLNALITRS